MSSSVVAALLKSLWPTLEPILLSAVSKILRDVIAAAKAQQLPDRYKWLEGPLDSAADEILKLLPA